MSSTEIAEFCDSLPPEKREEVADFARFLLARQNDARWETNIDAQPPATVCHPPGMEPWRRWSGGIVRLNSRLRSVIPPGWDLRVT